MSHSFWNTDLINFEKLINLDSARFDKIIKISTNCFKHISQVSFFEVDIFYELSSYKILKIIEIS
jgi:hypothetical protein